jgi:GNAT superfamily N-acetyltransferase
MIQTFQATLDDLEAVALLFDSYRQFYQQIPDLDGAREFIRQRLTNGDSHIILGSEGSQAAGFTQLYPIFTSVGMRRTWLLNDLFVHSAHRKKGVGEQLLEAAQEHARNTGSKWLMLETGMENIPAQRLYEKMGWKPSNGKFYQLTLD